MPLDQNPRTSENASQRNTRPFRWRRRLRAGILVLLLAFLAVNFVAFMQARAMTHFVERGTRTASPENLSRFGKIKVLLTGVRVPRPVNLRTPGDEGLEFQTLRFGGPADDECEAWYIPSSLHRGLCMQFHGYAASKSTLLWFATAFHDQGFDVLMVDFRGHGGSHGSETTIGYREADDIVDAAVFAQKKWAGEPVILFGQSMGASSVFRAVGELHVQVTAIIAESIFDRLSSTAANRFRSMGLPQFPLTQMLVFWGGIEEGFNGFGHNPVDYAANIHCPVLIMQGGADPRVTTAQARTVFDHLAGPKLWEFFPNSDHCMFSQDSPAQWNAAVSKFLKPLVK